MRKLVIFYVCAMVIGSCRSVKNMAVKTDINRLFNRSSFFSNQFTGFSLFDLSQNKFIAGYNETKRFTPASNTKLLTMYTALKSFHDSIPGLLYKQKDDSLWVQPVGDPTFLHDQYTRQPTFEFLRAHHSIHIVWPPNDIKPFGPGWAWDDYSYDFQPQRSWWPIYGNSTRIIKKDDSVTVSPSFFEDYVEVLKKKRSDELVERNLKYNHFTIYTDTSDFKRTLPFDYSRELLGKLLEDTLGTGVAFAQRLMIDPDTLYSHHIDSLLGPMMMESNNFLAEQLLILSAWKNGYTSPDLFLKHVKLIWLSDFNDFVWVDGSGLSRYNLIAPADVVRLLKRSCEEFGFDRVKNLLATGGQTGTIEEWFGAEEPYIFAKTGTLSNNFNLSGLLRTRSGKWMVFSFMNNHFTIPAENLKAEMQALLEGIRDSY